MSKKGKLKIKDEAQKKTKVVQVRMTASEKKDLEDKAKFINLSVSDLFRNSAFSAKIWTAKDKKIESEKIRQLARIGNNLNQISRFCNTYKSAADASQIVSVLLSIEYEIKAVFGG